MATYPSFCVLHKKKQMTSLSLCLSFVLIIHLSLYINMYMTEDLVQPVTAETVRVQETTVRGRTLCKCIKNWLGGRIKNFDVILWN